MLRFTIQLPIASMVAVGVLSNGTPVSAQFVETFKLTASDAAFDDNFGVSLDIDGNRAIAGAHKDDDAGSVSGSAYLFDTSTGNQLFKLAASDAATGDAFGSSVRISGNLAIVGAPLDDDAASGSNSSGSAYLFDVTTGNQLSKLTPSDPGNGHEFGARVGISGNTAIVGAFRDDHAGVGSGSAYLFDVSDPTMPVELFKLTASDAEISDWFGFSVAVSGNTAMVGARFDDNADLDTGSVYLFDVTTGNQIFKLLASDAQFGDFFGYSVAMSGNLAIVGAQGDDDFGTSSGSAYLFDVTNPMVPAELFKLTASDAADIDQFGESVGISGNLAIVGANGNDDAGPQSGSAYLFDVLTGNQQMKFTASDAEGFDQFGISVGISGDTAIVGALLDDFGPFDAGSAYLFGTGLVASVPEPSTFGLAAIAILCTPLFFSRRRKVHAANR